MIRIEIDTDNEAFRSGDPEGWRQEVAWLLHDIADRIATDQSMPIFIRDSNGKRFGQAEIDRTDPISATAGERETM